MSDYLQGKSDDAPRLDNLGGRDFHVAFAAEKRDPSWADLVEPRLREYFSRQASAGSFSILEIECHSTLCEILAVNRNPAATSVDYDSWQNVVYAMKREPWYRSAQIREPEVEFAQAKDGRVAILTHLVRE